MLFEPDSLRGVFFWRGHFLQIRLDFRSINVTFEYSLASLPCLCVDWTLTDCPGAEIFRKKITRVGLKMSASFAASVALNRRISDARTWQEVIEIMRVAKLASINDVCVATAPPFTAWRCWGARVWDVEEGEEERTWCT